MWQSLTIKRRLISAFAILIAVMMLIGGVAIYYLISINNSLQSIFTQNIPSLDYIIEADRDMQQLLVAERSMIFENAKSESFKGFVKEYEENLEQTTKRVNKYRELATSAEEKALLKEYDKAYEEWKVLSRQVVDGRIADTRNGRRLALDLTLGKAKEKFETMRDYLDKLTGLVLENARKSEKRAKDNFKIAIGIFIALLVLGCILAVWLSFLLSRSITVPLNRVMVAGESIGRGVLPEVALDESGKDELAKLSAVFNTIIQSLTEKSSQLTEIAEGNLTIDIHSLSEEDQFAKTFKVMLDSLNDTLGQAQRASVQVTVGSDQLSQISQSLASGTSEQAATIEEIESSLNEVSSQAETNAENADKAESQAGASRKTALKGNEQIQQLVDAMEKITGSADTIRTIVSSIDEIAFQTNLLALNAAVEAARAGQYGKGFAVVAEEVRSLARRSAKSAKSTTEKVEETISSINEVNNLVQETAKEFEEILSSSDTLASLVKDISGASQQQALGLEQIKTALEQVDRVIMNSAASAEENASTAEEFSAQAITLQNMVKRFQLRESINEFVDTNEEQYAVEDEVEY